MERKWSDSEECFIISCDVLAVGDYGGAGSVGEANIRSLEDREDALIDSRYGDYRQLWLRENDETLSIIQGLERDYPCVDDEEVSRVEAEWEQEAWDSYVRSDLIRTLPDELQEATDHLTDDTLFELYRSAMEITNTYPVTEYSGVHVRVEDIRDQFVTEIESEVVGNLQEASGMPTDTPYGILADWAEENGHPLAEAIRYLASQEQEVS